MWPLRGQRLMACGANDTSSHARAAGLLRHTSREPAATWFKKLHLTVQNELTRIEPSKLNGWPSEEELGQEDGADGGGRTRTGKPEGF